MASVIPGSGQSDVLQGGQVTLSQMFETYAGSGLQGTASGVTVGITAAPGPTGGSGTPVPVTSAGVLGLSGAQYQYTWNVPPGQAPGDYQVTWSGTVAGQQAGCTVTVTVAAVASGSPAPGVYASVAQYQAWSGDTLTPATLVQNALRRASELMDHYTIGAVYAVNPNGMPADAMVIDVFMRAVCAQTQFLLALNDPANVKSLFSSTSVGGVSATRAAKAQAMTFPPLAPQAAAILHTAGVLGSAALISW